MSLLPHDDDILSTDPILYTDFTFDNNLHFCSNEPLPSLYTDFTKAFLFVRDTNLFIAINHDKLCSVSGYYRALLSWNHGFSVHNPNPSSLPSRLIELPSFLSTLAVKCFADLLNGDSPMLIP